MIKKHEIEVEKLKNNLNLKNNQNKNNKKNNLNLKNNKIRIFKKII